MDEDELRSLLRYEAQHSRSLDGRALVSAGKRRRLRRRLAAATTLSIICFASVVGVTAVRGSSSAAEDTLAVAAAQPSGGTAPLSDSAADVAAGRACKDALVAQGVPADDRAVLAVDGAPGGWLVQAEPQDASQMPLGERWECDVVAGDGQEAVRVTAVRRTSERPPAVLDAAADRACSIAQRAVGAGTEGESFDELIDAVRQSRYLPVRQTAGGLLTGRSKPALTMSTFVKYCRGEGWKGD